METKFLDVPGGRLAYDVSGPQDAPLVICTPGMGDSRKVYRFLAPRLAAAGYRVATLDLRGQGESSVGWDDYRSAAASADHPPPGRRGRPPRVPRQPSPPPPPRPPPAPRPPPTRPAWSPGWP